MYKIPATNETMRRPLAAIGSERAARLAAAMNLDSGRTTVCQDNLLGHNPALVESFPHSGEGIARAPPHVLAIGSERPAHLHALEGPEATAYEAPIANDNKRRPLAAIGSERAARLAVKENLDPGQTKRLQHILNLNLEAIGSEREARLAALRNPSQSLTARQLQSTFLPERVPHPDRNPLPPPPPPPTSTATLTTGPDGLYLLLDKPPVPAESSWMSMWPEGKGGMAGAKALPELPLPLHDQDPGLLEDLHNVQAKNNTLAVRALCRMPNEQSRQRFQYELLRRQLRSEQQMTSFLEGMLGQVATAAEPPSLWMSRFGNGEEDSVATAGGEGGVRAPAKI